jgi:hypothetical protein
MASVLRLRPPPFVRWSVAFGILAVAVGTVAHAATSGGDFRLAIWFPGQAMLHGRDPYDIASFQRYYGSQQVEAFSRGWFPLYGPIHLWLAVFFGLFPVKVAAVLWFALNLGGLAVMAQIAVRALDGRLGGPAAVALTGILALTRPGRATLESGQATVVYGLLTYVVWSQARRRPLLAAVALACALGKPPFGLPLLALLLARRLWPVVARAVGLFVVASLPIVIWLSVNAGSAASVWHAVVHNLSYTDHNRLDAPGSPGRIDALSIIARYVHGHFGGGAEVAAFVVLVGLVAAFVARAARAPGWPLTPAVVLLLGVVTVLSVAHEYYDLLLLAWPFALVMGWAVTRFLDWREAADDRAPSRPHRGGALLAVTSLPALIVTIIPANDTLKLLGLGSGPAIISTLTTACLLLSMAGALAVVALHHPQEEINGADVSPVGTAPAPGTAVAPSLTETGSS